MLEHEKQIYEYEKTLDQLKEQNGQNRIWTDEELKGMEGKLQELKEKVYSELTAWQRVTICRHPGRPRGLDYISNLCEEFTEIHGDRLFRDDCSIITGFGIISGKKVVVIAQEKGCDTESRLKRNFGMTYPEGYRKALRAMQLAEKFHLPVLCLLDTPGAYPGLDAEERGQGWAIATNLMEMARLKTPIIALVIGEGCSGGALGIGVADSIAMLEHSYYSVISPEGCASILWKEGDKKEEAAKLLKLHAEDLIALGIVDTMIKEPLGGAHHNHEMVYASVREYVLAEFNRLSLFSSEQLVEKRYQKYRKMGRFLEPACV